MSDLTKQIETLIGEHVYAMTAPHDAWIEGIPEAAQAIVEELGLDP